MNNSAHQKDGHGKQRKFERIDIARKFQVTVWDSQGRKVGVLRQLGRGGFMMEPETDYSQDSAPRKFIIHEPQEDIRAEVHARVLYGDPRLVGFEFVELDADNAVEVGIIIGKYYEAEHSRNRPHES